jgi:hypothetical protein
MNGWRALSIVLLACLVPFPALAAEGASVPADEKTVMESGAPKTDESVKSEEEEEKEEGEEEEESSKFYGDVSALFVNNYYWRGTYLYPENVPAFQPGVTVGYWIFDLNLWSSIPMRLRDELKDERDELDLTFSATFEVGEHLSLSAGFLTYLMTTSRPFWHTEELYIAPTYLITEEFSVTLAVFGDVDAMKAGADRPAHPHPRRHPELPDLPGDGAAVRGGGPAGRPRRLDRGRPLLDAGGPRKRQRRRAGLPVFPPDRFRLRVVISARRSRVSAGMAE